MGEAGQEALWVYTFEKFPDDDWHSYTQPFERTCHLSKSKLYKRFSSAFQAFVPELFTADEAVGGDSVAFPHSHGVSSGSEKSVCAREGFIRASTWPDRRPQAQQ